MPTRIAKPSLGDAFNVRLANGNTIGTGTTTAPSASAMGMATSDSSTKSASSEQATTASPSHMENVSIAKAASPLLEHAHSSSDRVVQPVLLCSVFIAVVIAYFLNY